MYVLLFIASMLVLIHPGHGNRCGFNLRFSGGCISGKVEDDMSPTQETSSLVKRLLESLRLIEVPGFRVVNELCGL